MTAAVVSLLIADTIPCWYILRSNTWPCHAISFFWILSELLPQSGSFGKHTKGFFQNRTPLISFDFSHEISTYYWSITWYNPNFKQTHMAMAMETQPPPHCSPWLRTAQAAKRRPSGCYVKTSSHFWHCICFNAIFLETNRTSRLNHCNFIGSVQFASWTCEVIFVATKSHHCCNRLLG